MVIPLRASKFYGSSLPRPQIYTDIKYSEDRVDPPLSMVDPLLSWAQDAHWSMGGVNFKRVRHQGKIEGNLSKLRKEGEKRNKKNGVIAGKIEKLRDEEERVMKEKGGNDKVQKKIVAVKEKSPKKVTEKAKNGKVQKEIVVEKEKSPEKVIEKAKNRKIQKEIVSEKAKIGKVLRKRNKVSGKGDKFTPAPAPVPVSPTTESDGGLRRSKRRKLVLRDEDDEETEF